MPGSTRVLIAEVALGEEGPVSTARLLLREYASSLPVALDFQGFDTELACLADHYAPPHGVLIVAHVDGEPAACGGFRALLDTDHVNACEMKRLYVRPKHRGLGLGRRVAQVLIDRATESGYSCMLLDTLDDMEAARGLYASLGFVEIEPYYFNPLPGAHYLKVDLTAGAREPEVY
jgi:putative acetyltransferase